MKTGLSSSLSLRPQPEVDEPSKDHIGHSSTVPSELLLIIVLLLRLWVGSKPSAKCTPVLTWVSCSTLIEVRLIMFILTNKKKFFTQLYIFFH